MKTLGIIGFGAQLFFSNARKPFGFAAPKKRVSVFPGKKIWSRQKKTL